MKIVFATNNLHKLQEVQELLPFFKIVGLKDIGCLVNIPETANTLEGNARIKSNYVKENFNLNCFSDDTGLEVETLNGAPGVISARYAGEPSNDEKNIEKLLNALKNKKNRTAQFRTMVAVNIDSENFMFEGICKGTIAHQKKGNKGFGYDSIFIPEGSEKTFAEMTLEEKGKISHRGKAIFKLINFLQTLRY